MDGIFILIPPHRWFFKSAPKKICFWQSKLGLPWVQHQILYLYKAMAAKKWLNK
jgi:hypothetical protein